MTPPPSLAYNFINFVYAKLELISKLLSRKDEADVTGLETEETSELMFTESSINIVMNISLSSFLWYFSECLKNILCRGRAREDSLEKLFIRLSLDLLRTSCLCVLIFSIFDFQTKSY